LIRSAAAAPAGGDRRIVQSPLVNACTGGLWGGATIIGICFASIETDTTGWGVPRWGRTGRSKPMEIRGMKTRRVKDIILPYRADIPLNPWVSVDDRLTEAIRRMLDFDAHCIAVMRNDRPIGVVRLEDALKKIGLDQR